MMCIWHDDIVVTLDSCNSGHSKNYEKNFVYELEISYKIVENFVVWLIHSLENFRKEIKKVPVLKFKTEKVNSGQKGDTNKIDI